MCFENWALKTTAEHRASNIILMTAEVGGGFLVCFFFFFAAPFISKYHHLPLQGQKSREKNAIKCYTWIWFSRAEMSYTDVGLSANWQWDSSPGRSLLTFPERTRRILASIYANCVFVCLLESSGLSAGYSCSLHCWAPSFWVLLAGLQQSTETKGCV